jgi:hypothetical protein
MRESKGEIKNQDGEINEIRKYKPCTSCPCLLKPSPEITQTYKRPASRHCHTCKSTANSIQSYITIQEFSGD